MALLVGWASGCGGGGESATGNANPGAGSASLGDSGAPLGGSGPKGSAPDGEDDETETGGERSSADAGAESDIPSPADGGAGAITDPDLTPPNSDDTPASDDDRALGGATGCAGVFNPDQVLEYHITLPPADWTSLLADVDGTTYFEAQLQCGNEAPITVGVQRKRSGGAQKVGFKVDANLYVKGQRFHDLNKLVFENGVSSGSTTDDTDVGALASEYLGWRLLQLSGAMASRAAIARVIVNGGEPMAYVHVEPVNKRFLKNRLGNDGGWLYKKSGGDGDGLKTHEADGLENPHESYFCFWQGRRGSCSAPADLQTSLPERLDIQQMLRTGAVNALIANTDSPLPKDNNYYYYDTTAGVRVYLAWDLDSTMKASFDPVTGTVPGGVSMYRDVLFSHWQDEYVAILKELREQRLTEAAIAQELDRLNEVAGSTLNADPYVGGSTEEAIATLKAWWTQRRAEL